MATPHVAGVAGLMRAANPNLSVAAARQILHETAQPAGDALYFGSGIVDAAAAVAAALNGVVPPPPQSTRTTVSTDKPVYQQGDSVTISAKVLNQNGAALEGASVLFTFTRPNGTTSTLTATTNVSGIAVMALSSNSSTLYGTYFVKADTTISGYAGSSAQTSLVFAPPANPNTSTVIYTAKNVYNRGESVTITATVRRTDTNAVLSGASVAFMLRRPNGSTISATVTTNANGVATWTVSSNANTAIGNFTLSAASTLAGFNGSSASKTISFR
jgi:uncharacterized protein YfaS (alpha-2-macroglobulin family)